jgi:hypothetical protein
MDPISDGMETRTHAYLVYRSKAQKETGTPQESRLLLLLQGHRADAQRRAGPQ